MYLIVSINSTRPEPRSEALSLSGQSAKSRSEALSGFGAAETSSTENTCSLFPFWTNCRVSGKR